MDRSSGNPYSDEQVKSLEDGSREFVREFSSEVDDAELIWHRDLDDRVVHVMEGEDWKLQMDNELPKTLNVGQEYEIPKMVYHRLIKGNGSLVLRIQEI